MKPEVVTGNLGTASPHLAPPIGSVPLSETTCKTGFTVGQLI